MMATNSAPSKPNTEKSKALTEMYDAMFGQDLLENRVHSEDGDVSFGDIEQRTGAIAMADGGRAQRQPPEEGAGSTARGGKAPRQALGERAKVGFGKGGEGGLQSQEEWGGGGRWRGPL